MISGLTDTLFAVLDGIRRAAADACHTVSAVAAPDGPAFLNGNVVGRAEAGALAAAGTGVASRKRLCFDKERIEDRIHRATHEAVIKVVTGRRECLTGRDGGGRTINVWLRLGNDLLCFFCLGCVEHGNVIFGHDDLCRPHIGELFFPAKCMVIFGGIANLTAAGHNEPRLPNFWELRLAQPVFHQTGDAPSVGGRDDYQTLACLNR